MSQHRFATVSIAPASGLHVRPTRLSKRLMNRALPSPQSLLLETSLYQQFEVRDRDALWELIDFLYFDGTYDCYCTNCKRDATFKVVPPGRPDEHRRNKRTEANLEKLGGTPPKVYPPPGLHVIRSQCTRVSGHTQVFIYLVQQWPKKLEDGSFEISSIIQKVGQHPSFADVHVASLKRYAGVLSPGQLGELSRAMGLASHDVGIGAYVYLRRVFEALVEEAHQLARADAGWDEALYGRSRMVEKIELLKHHLPPFLVDNPRIYGLLSKGIHELTEEECLTHFETLRVSTELILDEKLQAKERSAKVAAAKAALDKASRGVT